ncbi:Phosphoinositide 3-kinase adapter protein 1, partial [Operophtera brumata]
KGKISASVATSDGVQEREEIFYTIPLHGRRRHSVGGYLTTDGAGSGEVTAVPSEVPRMQAPRVNPTEEDKMEDIAILWSSGSPESALWSDYLVASFDKIMSQRARHHYRVTPVTVEELLSNDSHEKVDKLSKAQLQILILCPNFAAKMAELKRDINCEEIFKEDKILVMLLGVEKKQVIANNCEEYPTIDQWQMMSVREKDTALIFQTLGFKTTSKEQLDSWMLSAFQKNIPPHFNLLASTEQFNPKADVSSGEEYPTLLHWAARFGLERVCWQLLECPGGGAAVALRNARHKTPAELARDHKHHRLADVLTDHLKINEFSNMYYYLKNMSDKDKEESPDEMKELRIVETCDTVDCPRETDSNDTTDPFSEACTQNLEDNTKTNVEKKPRPTLKLPKIREQLYQNEFPLNDTEHRIQQALEHDYLVQPSNIKVESPKFRPNNLYANSSRLMPMQSDIFLYSPTEESKTFTIDTPTSDISQINLTKEIRSPSVKSGKEICPLTGQEELAEIINDFKNNVFSISEVEKLVMEWKNRNETQQSLKEKQEQLNKMRDESRKPKWRHRETEWKYKTKQQSHTLTMHSACGEDRLDDYLIPPPPRPLNGSPQFTTFGHPKDPSGTHLRLNFASRDRDASRCDLDGAHMYMNISPSHT